MARLLAALLRAHDPRRRDHSIARVIRIVDCTDRIRRRTT